MCVCTLMGAYIQEGYFNDGVLDGFGRWICDDGLQYEGIFKNESLNGLG